MTSRFRNTFTVWACRRGGGYDVTWRRVEVTSRRRTVVRGRIVPQRRYRRDSERFELRAWSRWDVKLRQRRDGRRGRRYWACGSGRGHGSQRGRRRGPSGVGCQSNDTVIHPLVVRLPGVRWRRVVQVVVLHLCNYKIYIIATLIIGLFNYFISDVTPFLFKVIYQVML